jgi:hypothetical protein
MAFDFMLAVYIYREGAYADGKHAEKKYKAAAYVVRVGLSLYMWSD